MKKYFLKKFISVNQLGNKIAIGLPYQTDRYFEVEYDETVVERLKKCIISGITEKDIDNPLYQRLYDSNFLELIPKFIDNKDITRDKLYFDYLNNKNFTSDVLQTPVLIFGAGAGGSSLAYLMAQTGFKQLIVVDDDIVSYSDTLKSMFFKQQDVGKSKVHVLAKHFKKLFDVDIYAIQSKPTTYEQIESIIKQYNPAFVVKACDPSLFFRIHLNKICYRYKIPFLHMAYSYEYLKIGPLYVPEFTDCDNGFNELIVKHHGEHCDFKLHKRLFDEELAHPSISFNVNILSSFGFKEILMFLTKQYEYCFSIGRLVELNPLSLEVKYWEIECKNDCEVCKPA